MPTQNSGVYHILIKSTGDSYVGSSTDLKARLKAQQYEVSYRMHRKYHPDQFWISARKNYRIAQDDIEFRIIEFVECTTGEDRRCRMSKGLSEREVFWIRKLNPSLNVMHKIRPIVISDIPVGPPMPIDAALSSA